MSKVIPLKKMNITTTLPNNDIPEQESLLKHDKNSENHYFEEESAKTIICNLRKNIQTLNEKLEEQFSKTLEIIKEKRKLYYERKDHQRFSEITENIARVTKSFSEQNHVYVPHSPPIGLRDQILHIPYTFLFHPSNEAVCYLSYNNRIVLVDIKEKRDLRWFIGNSDKNDANVTSIDISEDGKYLISGTEDKVCKAFDIESGVEEKLFPKHSSAIRMVKFSFNGRFVLTVSGVQNAYILKIFGFEDETEKFSKGFDSNLYENIYFSRDDTYVIALDGKTIQFYETNTGTEFKNPIKIQEKFPDENSLGGSLYYDMGSETLFQVDYQIYRKFDFKNCNKINLFEDNLKHNIIQRIFINIKRREIYYLGHSKEFRESNYKFVQYNLFKYPFNGKVEQFNLTFLYPNFSTLNRNGTHLINFMGSFIYKHLTINESTEKLSNAHNHLRNNILVVSLMHEALAIAPKFGEPIRVSNIKYGNTDRFYALPDKTKLVGMSFNSQRCLITFFEDGTIRKYDSYNQNIQNGTDIKFENEKKEDEYVHYCCCSANGNNIVIAYAKESMKQDGSIKWLNKTVEKNVEVNVAVVFTLKQNKYFCSTKLEKILINSKETFSHDEDFFAYKTSNESKDLCVLRISTSEKSAKSFESEAKSWIFSSKSDYCFVLLTDNTFSKISLKSEKPDIILKISSQGSIESPYLIMGPEEEDDRIAFIINNEGKKKIELYKQRETNIELVNSMKVGNDSKSIIYGNFNYCIIESDKEMPIYIDFPYFKKKIDNYALNIDYENYSQYRTLEMLSLYCYENILGLHDLKTGKIIWEKTFKTNIKKAAFINDDSCLVVFVKDSAIYLKKENGEFLARKDFCESLKSVWNDLNNFALVLTEQVNAQKNDKIFIYGDPSFFQPICEIKFKKEKTSYTNIVFRLKSNTIVVLFENRKLRTFNMESGKKLKERSFNFLRDKVSTINLFSGEKLSALLYFDGTVEVFDMDNNTTYKRIQTLMGKIFKIELGLKNDYLILISDKNQSLIYGSPYDKPKYSCEALKLKEISQLKFSEGNELNVKGIVKLDDNQENSENNIIHGQVNYTSVSPNNKFIIFTEPNYKISLYEMSRFGIKQKWCKKYPPFNSISGFKIRGNRIEFFDEYLDYFKYEVSNKENSLITENSKFPREDNISMVILSKDEKAAIRINNDEKRVDILDLDKGQKIFTIYSEKEIIKAVYLQGNQKPINKQIAILSDEFIEIFELPEFKPLKTIKNDFTGNDVEVSDKGDYFVAWGNQGMLILYNSETYEVEKKFTVDEKEDILKVAFSKSDKDVKVIALLSSFEILIFGVTESNVIHSLSFKLSDFSSDYEVLDILSSKSSQVYFQQNDRLACYDLNYNKEINTYKEVDAYFFKMTFNADESLLVVLEDKSIYLFHAESLVLSQKIDLDFRKYRPNYHAASFSFDSSQVLVNSYYYFNLYETETGKTIKRKSKNKDFINDGTNADFFNGGILCENNLKEQLEFYSNFDELENDETAKKVIKGNSSFIRSPDGNYVYSSDQLIKTNTSEFDSINLKDTHKIEKVFCFSNDNKLLFGQQNSDRKEYYVIFDIIRNKIKQRFYFEDFFIEKASFIKDDAFILLKYNDQYAFYRVEGNKLENIIKLSQVIEQIYKSGESWKVLLYDKGFFEVDDYNLHNFFLKEEGNFTNIVSSKDINSSNDEFLIFPASRNSECIKYELTNNSLRLLEAKLFTLLPFQTRIIYHYRLQIGNYYTNYLQIKDTICTRYTSNKHYIRIEEDKHNVKNKFSIESNWIYPAFFPDLRYFICTSMEGNNNFLHLISIDFDVEGLLGLHSHRLEFPKQAQYLRYFFSPNAFAVCFELPDGGKLENWCYIYHLTLNSPKSDLFEIVSKLKLFSGDLIIICNCNRLIFKKSENELALLDIFSNSVIANLNQKSNSTLLRFFITEDERLVFSFWDDGEMIVLLASTFFEVQRIKINLKNGSNKFPSDISYNANFDKLILFWGSEFQVLSNLTKNIPQVYNEMEFDKFDLKISDAFALSPINNIKINAFHTALLSKDLERTISLLKTNDATFKYLFLSLLTDLDENKKSGIDYLFDNPEIETINKAMAIILSIIFTDFEDSTMVQKMYPREISRKKEFFEAILKSNQKEFDKLIGIFLIKSNPIKAEKKDKSKAVYMVLNSPYYCGDLLKNEYHMNQFGENRDESEKAEDLDVYICLITPGEFLDIFKVFSNLPSTHPVFINKTLIILIEFIWANLAKKIFLRNFFLYIIYLLILCINLLWIFPLRTSQANLEVSEYLGIVSIIFNCLISVFLILLCFGELFTLRHIDEKDIRKKIRKYFESVWNIFDIFIFIIGLCSIALDFSEMFNYEKNNQNLIKIFYSILLYISWARLIEYARGFYVTSALIRLLTKVFEDMFGFLIILTLAVVGSALSTYLLQSNYESYNPWEFIKIFYNVLLGDFGDYSGINGVSAMNTELYFLIFLVLTVFIVIVMLNLLIAIISDSFEKVMAQEEHEKTYERFHIMLETFRTISEKYKKDFKQEFGKKFIYVFQRNSEESSEDIQERLRNKIDRLESKIEDIPKKIEELKSDISQLKSTNEEMKSKMEDIGLKLDLFFAEMNKKQNN